MERLVGRIIKSIVGSEGDDRLALLLDDDSMFTMDGYCEYGGEAYICDICGDPDRIIGHKIVKAWESELPSDDEDVECPLYNIQTDIDILTIRWRLVLEDNYSVSVRLNHETSTKGYLCEFLYDTGTFVIRRPGQPTVIKNSTVAVIKELRDKLTDTGLLQVLRQILPGNIYTSRLDKNSDHLLADILIKCLARPAEQET